MILNFPTSPYTGQTYVGDNEITYMWDGVKWLGKGFLGNLPKAGTSTYILTPPSTGQIGGVKAGSGVTIGPDGTISVPDYSQAGPTPPTLNLQDGDLWYDTNDGNLYVRYNNVWVSAVTTVVGPQGPQGPKGDTGSQGLGFTDKGNWSNNAFYVTNDVVFYQGSSYVAIQSNQGNLPTNTVYWTLIAAQGAQGQQGAQGIQGPQGPQGVKGDKGNAGTIATASTLGVIKTGDPAVTNVNIAVNGTISVPKGAGINTVADIPDVNSTNGGAALNDGALLVYNASNQRWDTINNLRSDSMDGGFF